MATEQVSARITSGDHADKSATVNYTFPDSLSEAEQMYPDGVALNQLNSAITIALQSFIRVQLKKEGATEESIQAAVDAWKPSMRTPGKSKVEKATDLLAKLTAEERAELLASLG